MENVHVRNIWNQQYSWKRITWTIVSPARKTKDLTLKQMFDISAKLVSDQSDEIYGEKTIDWEDSSWKYLSLIGDEHVISLQRTKVHVFSDYDCVLIRYTRTPQSHAAWEQRLEWFKSSPVYRTLDRIEWWANGIRVEYFPTIHHIAALPQSPRVTVEITWDTREFHRKDYLHVDVQRHLLGIKRQWKRMLDSFLFMHEDLEQDNGHFSVLVQRKSGLLSVKTVHKVNGTKWQRRWCWHSQKADTQSSEPRVHCPEVNPKAKAVENCRYTMVPIWKRLKVFFAQLFL